MPNQGMTIDYTEASVRDGGSPEMSFDNENGGSGTRVFLIAPADLSKALYQILGYSWKKGGKIRRWLPEYMPHMPQMVAKKITRIRGIGSKGEDTIINGQFGAKKVNSYKKIEITVQYETPEYYVRTDDEIDDTDAYPLNEFHRYVVPKLKPAAEFLTIPITSLSFTEATGFLTGKPLHKTPETTKSYPSQSGKILGTRDVTYSWREVPQDAVPWTQVFGYIGKVNKTAWNDPDTISADAHTMLMLPPDLRRIRNAYGEWCWHIDYHFKYQAWGFNRLFDWDIGALPATRVTDFFRVSSDGVDYPPEAANATGKRIFDEAEFKDLFKSSA